jgi:hypothetical protein
MIVNGDFILKGNIWIQLRDNLIAKNEIFTNNVDLFIIACGIGIAADEQKDFEGETAFTIARDTYQMEPDRFEIFNSMFRNAVLTSKKIDISIEERMKIAFDSDYNVNDISAPTFMIKFANYGADKIMNICSDYDLKTIDELIGLIEDYSENNYKDLLEELDSEIIY